jgi:hypothetical protein
MTDPKEETLERELAEARERIKELELELESTQAAAEFMGRAALRSVGRVVRDVERKIGMPKKAAPRAPLKRSAKVA